VRNSLLKIHTKPQRIEGKVWSAASGFKIKEFNYTSGLINSGTSFRQKYGIFSAKIKLGNPSARNNFWMLADKITPHIDICRTSNNKVWTDFVADPGRFSKSSIGPRYANDFYIYTSNGLRIARLENQRRRSSNRPQMCTEPMYILLVAR
jgi:hypothetical protein